MISTQDDDLCEVNTIDDDDPIRRGYERNADYWVKIIREGRDPYQRDITDPALHRAIGNPSDLDLLDAGCGEGHFARELVRRGARHVHGVDIAAALIEAAATHPAADPATSTFVQGDVANLPLPDACVDVIYANRLPHALTDPGRRFAEFARVLRPGGRFIYLSLHPCFYVARSERSASGTAAGRPNLAAADYFAGRTIVQRFDVGGLVSPAPSVQRFYSLETHCSLITDAGFVIQGVREPRPEPPSSGTQDVTASLFSVPLFLLLDCTIRA